MNWQSWKLRMAREKNRSRTVGPLRRGLVWVSGPASGTGLLIGLATWNYSLMAVGIVGIVCFAMRVARSRRVAAQQGHEVHRATPDTGDAPLPDVMPPLGSEATSDELFNRMVKQGRYALVLRAQIADYLVNDQIHAAVEMLDDAMALVPSGQVVVGPIDAALDEGRLDAEIVAHCNARLAHVEPVFLDRYPVTNRQYYEFVTAGGYEDMAIWDDEVWPEVLDLVDRSGAPGPKFWHDGRYAEGEADHPVVGINWYEASAFARWAGKRLPADAEWVKAGAWPVAPRPDVWLQRKYPWGNTFDFGKANLWGSGQRGRVAVQEFGQGVSAGGLHQLIGNVWEWTSANFGTSADASLTLPVPMKSIRGGAFDTYFENQATCNFQSGENPLSRKHNIGVRLAIGLAELSPTVARKLQLETPPVDVPLAEEVCA